MPVAIHRVGRGNDFPSFLAVRDALRAPLWAGLDAPAPLLRGGGVRPSDARQATARADGAFVAFGPDDC